MKKTIITLDEFFRLKQMISASDEDLEVALAIWNNKFKDKKIIDKLMCKALMFDKRVKFSIAVEYVRMENDNGCFTKDKYMNDMKTTNIYTYLDGRKANKIYIDILNKITK